jgi:hypothetical protein
MHMGILRIRGHGERVSEALMREMEVCTDDPLFLDRISITYYLSQGHAQQGRSEEAARAEQILTSLGERAAAAVTTAVTAVTVTVTFYQTRTRTAVPRSFGRAHKARAAFSVLQRMVTA